jgi:glutamyl-tRNA reductase
MRASAAGRRHPLLMIDLAVPRDIDPRVSDLPNVFLYNIDDLEGIVQQNIQRRRQDIPRAEAIVNFEAERFAQWMESLSVVPTIKLLQQRVEALLADEVRRYGRKFAAGDAEQLQEFARSLSNKILHSPIAFLREASNKGIAQDDPAAIDLFRRMFDLDASEEDQR